MSEDTAPKTHSILVVDDEEPILNTMRTLLEGCGHSVETALGASPGLRAIRKSTFDFIFLDYLMPAHDGIWFMQVAQLPPETRVILMTAHLTKALTQRMFKLGIVGYVVKPFKTDDIIRNLTYHSTPRPLQQF